METLITSVCSTVGQTHIIDDQHHDIRPLDPPNQFNSTQSSSIQISTTTTPTHGRDRRCVNALTPHDCNHTQLGGAGYLCPPLNPQRGKRSVVFPTPHERNPIQFNSTQYNSKPMTTGHGGSYGSSVAATATARSSTGSGPGNVEPTTTINQ